MMPYVKIDDYQSLEFSSNTPPNNLYRALSVEDILKCSTAETGFRCRTVGYLHNKNGQHYLKNIERHITNIRCEVEVSLSKVKWIPSAVPFPVHILGEVFRRQHAPILVAKIVEPMSPILAMRLYETLKKICSEHLATAQVDEAISDSE